MPFSLKNNKFMLLQGHLVQFKQKFLQIIIGFIMLCIFIWVRVIRERLPRDLPFNLTFWGLILLLIICCSYVYMIYKQFKPISSNNFIKKLFPLLQILIIPLVKLNQFILSNKYLRHLIKYLLILLQLLFKTNIVKGTYHNIYAFLMIMPKIILMICLIIDCFIFKQLYLIYTCIMLILFPLIIQYLLNISEAIKKADLAYFNNYFIVQITSKDLEYTQDDYDEEGFLKENIPTYFEDPSLLKYYCFYENFDDVKSYVDQELKEYKYLTLNDFIEYQGCAIYFNNILYDYKILFHDEREDTVTAKNIVRHLTLNKLNCEKLLQLYINIYVLKDYFAANKNYYNGNYVGAFYQKLLIIINIIILSCWLYILLISASSLSVTPNMLEILKSFSEDIEPFSQTLL